MADIEKVYLDVCTLCRPFDNQQMMRIKLETDAFYLILQNILSGNYTMVVSPVHTEEIQAIEDPFERSEIVLLISQIAKKIKPSIKLRQRAEYLYEENFGIADAAHIAYAEDNADVFISCDDRLVKKCKKLPTKIPAMNPIEFCNKENIK